MVFAAIIFTVLSISISIFHLALALGASLGEYTIGGKFPGKLPTKMRVGAIVQIFILLFFNFIVLAKAGIAFKQYYGFGKIGIWFIIVFFYLWFNCQSIVSKQKRKTNYGPS